MPTWLTGSEAIRHMNIARATFYKMVKEGKVIGYTLPGMTDPRYKLEELDALFTPANQQGEEREDAPMGHTSAEIRETLNDAFEWASAEEKDWWQRFESVSHARHVLNQLSRSSDIVPRGTVEEALEYLESTGFDVNKGIAPGCTYAKLVRSLGEVLTLDLERQARRDTTPAPEAGERGE